jgi:hypothetical protein
MMAGRSVSRCEIAAISRPMLWSFSSITLILVRWENVGESDGTSAVMSRDFEGRRKQQRPRGSGAFALQN